MKEKMSVRLMVFSLILLVLFAPGFALAEVPEFHINPATDSVDDAQAEGFLNRSITGVTSVLGSPSMVRDNPSDPSLVDYIFIGNDSVYIFSMTREEKTVVNSSHHSRGEWDGGLYMTYAEAVA